MWCANMARRKVRPIIEAVQAGPVVLPKNDRLATDCAFPMLCGAEVNE